MPRKKKVETTTVQYKHPAFDSVLDLPEEAWEEAEQRGYTRVED